ncbi:hypothetical protein BKA64DRAFT_698373 [Cadophora sp. MPI-SDFR-AT-0126]|nr:hypothetical protein BKA64DRAFT_698373 [Leotiomycetes sp. MPI-SDFR-AT-0126]
MADPTIVLISGVTRGIGKALLQSYLSRPNHIVIGTVREKSSHHAIELTLLLKASNTILILLSVESTSTTEPTSAIPELLAVGISMLDVVIANAGGTGSSAAPFESVNTGDMEDVFVMNVLGPLALFQAVKPLLERSERLSWVTITSAAGSIGGMERFVGSHMVPAYGVSKVALNWLTMAAHCGNHWLIAFAVHPGLIQTEPGNHAAKIMGMEQAPVTKEECADSIVRLIDNASRETSPGKFFNAIPENTLVGGVELPW